MRCWSLSRRSLRPARQWWWRVGRTEVLAASDAVVTASGTATVQTAIHQRPMVVVYRLSALTYRIVKTFSHVRYAGMANLIAGERVVPELLQDAFTPAAVAKEVVSFLTDAPRARRTRAALGRVGARLGSVGASRRTAEHVLAVAEGQSRIPPVVPPADIPGTLH